MQSRRHEQFLFLFLFLFFALAAQVGRGINTVAVLNAVKSVSYR